MAELSFLHAADMHLHHLPDLGIALHGRSFTERAALEPHAVSVCELAAA